MDEEKEFVEKPKKEKKEREGRSVLSRIVNIVLWVVLFAWMALVLVDYFHVRNEEEPQFCWWNKQTHEHTDGNVTECTGLGYKVIRYNRDSFKAIEFGPFWASERNADQE